MSYIYAMYAFYSMMIEKREKQAGAELYQAQFELGLAKHGLSSLLSQTKLSLLS